MRMKRATARGEERNSGRLMFLGVTTGDTLGVRSTGATLEAEGRKRVGSSANLTELEHSKQTHPDSYTVRGVR
ncbi:MAG: hypothetical protein HY709_12230 [Candidatus Latescibacteria bacterium]|nr:hypothetical protein [Candidatus Latescibacterota bacterium]